MVRWTIKLEEFDILYLRRPTIRAQIRVDFSVECCRKEAQPEAKEEPNTQELHVDRSLSKEGNGVRLILT